MNLNIGKKRQPLKHKIRIPSLKDLLLPRKLVKLPEQKLDEILLQGRTPRTCNPLLHVRSKSVEVLAGQVYLCPMHRRTTGAILQNQQLRQTCGSHSSGSRKEGLRKRILTGRDSQQRAKEGLMWKPRYFMSSPGSIRMKQSDSIDKNAEVQSRKMVARKSDFLRKGTDINKRVVTNLLKIKLASRNEQPGEVGGEIRNAEILRMIQLCKGYGEAKPHAGLPPEENKHFGSAQKTKMFPLRNYNIELSLSNRRGEHENSYQLS